MKSTIYHYTPAPVLASRTASYCTENEGTPLSSRPKEAQREDMKRSRFSEEQITYKLASA